MHVHVQAWAIGPLSYSHVRVGGMGRQPACLPPTLLINDETIEPRRHHITGASCRNTRNTAAVPDTTHLVASLMADRVELLLLERC